MKTKKIKPGKKIAGEIAMPGDKSISHRAVMAGAIAQGSTRVRGLLDSDDCNYTIRAFQEMGIAVKKDKDITYIEGKALNGLSRPAKPLNVGESGTTMRILCGILAGQDFETTLVGAESLSHRPMKRVVEPLSLMGVDIKARDHDLPPLVIRGGNVRPIDYRMPVSSAQVKSAILFAGLYAGGATRVEEAAKTRDHTERMLKYFGADIRTDRKGVCVTGGRELSPKELEIPGDISSASFFIAAATLLEGSKLRIENVGVNPTRAGILNVLSKMGARIRIRNKREVYEPVADIDVEHARTRGIIITKEIIPSVIDELPVIFVIAALSRGRTVIKGAQELRVKETDRIGSMVSNLAKMGARIEAKADEVVIEGVSGLHGADLKSFGDHRTCMSMAVAALAAKGESRIDDAGCVTKSFPQFFDLLDRVTR